MIQGSFDKFKELLDSKYVWPTDYLFKFIVKKEFIEDLKNCFPQQKLTLKDSSGGKYCSVTFSVMMKSSDEVIEVYKKASTVQSIISL
jgi:putative lipoic acid-binding regulatory protein